MIDRQQDASLPAAVEALAARVSAIEAHLGLAPELAPAVPDTPPAVIAASAPPAPQGEDLLPSVGFAFLMLAGAFLLRALTGTGMLAGPVGVSLGVAYVALLLVLTDRAARRDLRSRALVFGASSVLVAYPFIWETSAKLHLIPAAGAAAVTALLAAAGLVVSLRHRLPVLAWITLVAAVATSTGLAWNTDATNLFVAVLIALGAATLWLGYLRGWQGPRWFVAGVVNFLVFVVVMLAAHPGRQATGRPEPDPEGALLVAIALPVVYLASFAWRTLAMRREAGGFEILQSLGCIVAGYVGAIHLLRVSDHSTAALGWATVVVAIAGYAVAFMLVRSRQGRGLNFFYFAWLGLLLMLVGSALVVSASVLPYLWCGLAVGTAVSGSVFDRWTLRLHCAAYLTGAAVVSGLATSVFAAFASRQTPAWADWSTSGLVAWFVSAVCYVLLVTTQRGRADSPWRRIPHFLTSAFALIGGGALLVTGLAIWLSALVPGPDEAVVAAVRTAVLAGSAVVLATLGRRPALRELAWFAGPLLGVAAVKVLLEDLRRGTPISLFVGFACLGIALIVAPRLLRRHPDTDDEGEHVSETP